MLCYMKKLHSLAAIEMPLTNFCSLIHQEELAFTFWIAFETLTAGGKPKKIWTWSFHPPTANGVVSLRRIPAIYSCSAFRHLYEIFRVLGPQILPELKFGNRYLTQIWATVFREVILESFKTTTLITNYQVSFQGKTRLGKAVYKPIVNISRIEICKVHIKWVVWNCRTYNSSSNYYGSTNLTLLTEVS